MKLSQVKTLLNSESSFDIIIKTIKIANTNGYLFMIDAMVKDDILYYITNKLTEVEKLDTIDKFTKENLNFMEVDIIKNENIIYDMFFSGASLLVIEEFDEVIVIDARTYPVRSIEEPDLEKVSRGSRDGFCETLIFNTALIRRRIKDSKLCFKLSTVGSSTRTNISVCYLDNKVDKKLLQRIITKLEDASNNDLVNNERGVVELLFKESWINPLPKVRFTERPDVCSSHILEGHIVLLVDTSPNAIILPVTIFHFTQHMEDYGHHKLVGTYIRSIRFISIIITLLLIPIWYLYVKNGYSNIDVNIYKLLFELLILELCVDLLKISSLHTPSTLSMPLGLIGGIILGDLSIKSGIFMESTVLVTALTMLCTFSQTQIEFGYALKMFRFFILIMSALFNYVGFIISLIIIFVIGLTTNREIKYSYYYPLIPFNLNHLKHVLFRIPVVNQKK